MKTTLRVVASGFDGPSDRRRGVAEQVMKMASKTWSVVPGERWGLCGMQSLATSELPKRKSKHKCVADVASAPCDHVGQAVRYTQLPRSFSAYIHGIAPPAAASR
jgi:hypothetical protein